MSDIEKCTPEPCRACGETVLAEPTREPATKRITHESIWAIVITDDTGKETLYGDKTPLIFKSREGALKYADDLVAICEYKKATPVKVKATYEY